MAAEVPPTSAPGPLPLEGAAATQRVAWLSVGVAVTLSLLKLGGWLVSGSVSLLASLADSGLDMVAALGTLTALRLAITPPDAEHRYGHGKAEAFASLVQAALVFVAALAIGRQAVLRLIHPFAVHAEFGALAIMAISTVLAGVLVIAQGRVLAATRSAAIEGDRMHYLADVAGNITAFVGIAAAAVLHAPRADAAAGLAVSVWLLWGAFSLLRIAADNLMDRELDEQDRTAITGLILRDPQVFGLRDLRTRASGPIVHIQAHLALDPHQTVEAAHHLLVEAENRILASFPAADIMLQPDPHGRAEPHGGAFATAVREGPAAQPVVTPRTPPLKNGP